MNNNSPALHARSAQSDRVLSIMVVDDDDEASRAIAEMLRHLGETAVVCSNASGAMERVRAGKLDLMLIDYRMPELTGIDLISMLREEGFQIPVIMMSGYSVTEQRVDLEKSGVFTILKKPITLSELREAIDAGVGSSTPGHGD